MACNFCSCDVQSDCLGCSGIVQHYVLDATKSSNLAQPLNWSGPIFQRPQPDELTSYSVLTAEHENRGLWIETNFATNFKRNKPLVCIENTAQMFSFNS